MGRRRRAYRLLGGTLDARRCHPGAPTPRPLRFQVYAVLQTNPPRLYSNLQFVQRWRNPLSLKSEAGCYFTHLQAATSFLDNLATEEQQRRHEAEGGPPPPPPPPLPPPGMPREEEGEEAEELRRRRFGSSPPPPGSPQSPRRCEDAGGASPGGLGPRGGSQASLAEGAPPSLCLTRGDIEAARSVSYMHAASDWQQQIETLIADDRDAHAPPSRDANHDPLGNLPAEPARLPSRLEIEGCASLSRAASLGGRGMGGGGGGGGGGEDGGGSEEPNQLFPPQVDSSDEEEGVGVLRRASRRVTL